MYFYKMIGELSNITIQIWDNGAIQNAESINDNSG